MTPVPTTQALEVTAEGGQTVEVDAVCTDVHVTGIESPRARLEWSLEVLDLDPGPEETCDVELVLRATGNRTCATYTGLQQCCPGWEISGEFSLRTAAGEVIGISPVEVSLEPPSSTSSCPGRNEPIESDVLNDLMAVAVHDWFGLPFVSVTHSVVRTEDDRIEQALPLTDDGFWRLVTALYNDESRDSAARHLRYYADGSPLFLEAVPHLLAVTPSGEWSYNSALGGLLAKITGVDTYGMTDYNAQRALRAWWDAHQNERSQNG